MEIVSQMSDMNRNIQSLMSKFGNQPLVVDSVCVKENRGMAMYPIVEPMSPRKEEIQVMYLIHQIHLGLINIK